MQLTRNSPYGLCASEHDGFAKPVSLPPDCFSALDAMLLRRPILTVSAPNGGDFSAEYPHSLFRLPLERQGANKKTATFPKYSVQLLKAGPHRTMFFEKKTG